MTIRDKVRELRPELIDKNWPGGCVKGCPSDCGFEGYDLCDSDCSACWSQEYREEPKAKPKKKCDVSVVLIVLAVLEVVAGGIAIVRGDSEMAHFCCVMGMLDVIAAGVWRDRS